MNAPLPSAPVKTTCPYCGVGCGVIAKPDGIGGATVIPDPAHPANRGRICSKGAALGETLGLDGRLLTPMLRDAQGTYQATSWTDALDRVASGFRSIIAEHGPDAVAFYVSGQMLTEDYYVANKLMKGFIGSGNIDTNSRLCMASSVAGHRRAFGSDTVPGVYEDLDEADVIVLVGSNAAWCHPVLHQRMLAARAARGTRIVVIDPRHTVTADEADLVLKIAPGKDTVLFSGLLAYLDRQGKFDRAFVRNHTSGLAETLAIAHHLAPNLSIVAEEAGLAPDEVRAFFDLFATTQRVVTCYSQGVNQSAQGTDKVNAIINCHLATGRIGKPGMGPFSLTGQPNAMGGRETGGLANMLAAHMGFDAASVDRVGRFWNSETMATREGLKAVDMFKAVAAGHVKALWVMATNPVVSMPDADAVRRALGNLELFVVSENMRSTDTINAGAHVLLPALAWGEKTGTVTNSERRISRQRSFLGAPGEAKADWWIISEVARRLGHGAAFAYQSSADIFREYAALTAFENAGTRDLDLGAFATLGADEYDALLPTLWPAQEQGTSKTRFFADGQFYTPDKRARFIPPARPHLALTSDHRFPLLLNTGRVRDHWHTMSRTGKSPRLAAHILEPYVEIHPSDAALFGLEDGDMAEVMTGYGRAVYSVRLSWGQRRGMLFVPIHWNGETASDARVGALSAPIADPVSGQPEMKATPARIARVKFDARGLLVTRGPIELPSAVWFARAKIPNGVVTLLAADRPRGGFATLARGLFGAQAILAEYDDRAGGIYRAARFDGNRVTGALFMGPDPSALPSWEWTAELLGGAVETDARAILAGRPAHGAIEQGPTVCACFGVGLGDIVAAIRTGTACDVDTIGAALKAGTNCGSCKPELKRIIASVGAAVRETVQ
jgi:assimilatory nitrate reductase catalytic subunit